MRSLILAGGGIKVGYQAGCLQVFDEIGLKFDHVDAASGGCFNAAMMANGMSGREIADQWRNMNPLNFLTLDWRNYYKGPWNRSFGTADGLRHIFRNVWKLDFDRIQNCTEPSFTFNHFDFTSKRVEIVDAHRLTEDVLIASTTLLMWQPAVAVGPNRIFDAVWCTDGNVGEAVRRGAKEIWAIWTVSDTPEVRDGFLAEYFHLIETVSNAKFKEEWCEIEAVNESIKAFGAVPGDGTGLQLRAGFDPKEIAKQPPPPGRVHIEQHLIRQEVPVHYLFNVSRDRMAAAVEMGVQDTCAYARRIGLLPAEKCHQAAVPADTPAVSFTETMRGFFMPGAIDPSLGERQGRRAGNALTARLAFSTQDLNAFLHRPQHQGTVTGEVDAPLLCGTPMRVTAGSISLWVNDRAGGIVQPGRKRMLYVLEFADTSGTHYRLSGHKLMRDTDGFAVWPDTTTLYSQLEARAAGVATWGAYGAGILHVRLPDFLYELTTFRVANAAGPRSAAAALGRFAAFWAGQCLDVYARRIIDYAPF